MCRSRACRRVRSRGEARSGLGRCPGREVDADGSARSSSLASHVLRRCPSCASCCATSRPRSWSIRYERLLNDFQPPPVDLQPGARHHRPAADRLPQAVPPTSTIRSSMTWRTCCGKVIGQCKPIYFYLDAYDEFSHAPMYWLKCQEGKVCSTRSCGCSDHTTRGAARRHLHPGHRHVVVYRSEHAPRTTTNPQYGPDLGSRLAALPARAKLAGLPASLLRRRRHRAADIRDWLGSAMTGRTRCGRTDRGLPVAHQANPRRHHLARQRAERGGAAAEQAGHEEMSPKALAAMVQRCAKRAVATPARACANEISSDLMPKNCPARLLQVVTRPQAISAACRRTCGLRPDDRRRPVSRGTWWPCRKWRNCTSSSRRPRLRPVGDGLLGYVDEIGGADVSSIGHVRAVSLPAGGGHVLCIPCRCSRRGIPSLCRRTPPGAGEASPHPPAPVAKAAARRSANRPAGGARGPDRDPVTLYAAGDVIDGPLRGSPATRTGRLFQVYRVRR